MSPVLGGHCKWLLIECFHNTRKSLRNVYTCADPLLRAGAQARAEFTDVCAGRRDELPTVVLLLMSLSCTG